MVTFDEFKDIFDIIPGKPEFEFYFFGNPSSYMLIKHEDDVIFCRCGNPPTPEISYPSLEDLCNAVLIDGISLRRNWSNVEQIEVDSTWILSSPFDVEDLLNHYRRE